jgi:RNA polymerase sigma-70 factor (ECF subfamily)
VTLPGGTAVPKPRCDTATPAHEQPCLSATPPRTPAELARDDDASLVVQVGAGSVAAFAVLVERYSATLYRAAARMLADPHEAEDVVQDCFARLWQHAAGWQPSGAGLVGWLHRVTINLCFDRKRRFRVITTSDLPDRVDDAPLADRLIEAEQAHAEMADALAALPDRYRAALMLCYMQGFSNAAAADMLNLNIKAMESLLHRARRHLREILVQRQVVLGDLVVVADIEPACAR